MGAGFADPGAPIAPDLLRDWIAAGVVGMTVVRAEVNELNVFPIADSDTGTNMLATLSAAEQAVAGLPHDASVTAVARRAADGATSGARGNSGIILAQVLVGLADAAEAGARDGAVSFTDWWVRGLRLASLAAARAVSEPMEGTVLTVLRGAADTAGAESDQRPADLARSVAERGADELERTTETLAVLAQSGVVDAGARGLLVLLDALVEVLTGAAPQRRHYRAQGAVTPAAGGCQGEPIDDMDFEVMYVLAGSDVTRVAELRTRLDEIGNAVVIVGETLDGAERFSVHVHTNDPGAAVDAGIAAGALASVRICCFFLDAHRAQGSQTTPPRRRRAVLAVVDGEAAAELFEEEGARVVRIDEEFDADTLTAAIHEADSAHLIVMANGSLPAPDLLSVGAATRSPQHMVVFLPTSSMTQALAALAVHDIGRQADDDAYAMAEAAAAARWGSVTVATEEALTFAGTYHPGDLLGSVGNDVLVIEPDATAAAGRLLDTMLDSGGELVTLLLGDGVDPALPEAVEAHLQKTHPGVEVVTYAAGQQGQLLQIGVE